MTVLLLALGSLSLVSCPTRSWSFLADVVGTARADPRLAEAAFLPAAEPPAADDGSAAPEPPTGGSRADTADCRAESTAGW